MVALFGTRASKGVSLEAGLLWQYSPLLVIILAILFGDFSGADITYFNFNTSTGWS